MGFLDSLKQAASKPKKRPARYKLYDKLKISQKTVDIILIAAVVLLVVCLFVGIFIGK